MINLCAVCDALTEKKGRIEVMLQELTRSRVLDTLREMERLEAQLSRLEATSKGLVTPDYPPLNVWAADETVVVLAEIPGIDPSDIDISVVNRTLKLWGCRQPEDLEDGEGYRRRERDYGQFSREYELPFLVDVDNVEAKFCDGVLLMKLPKAQEERPKRIVVETD